MPPFGKRSHRTGQARDRSVFKTSPHHRAPPNTAREKHSPCKVRWRTDHSTLAAHASVSKPKAHLTMKTDSQLQQDVTAKLKWEFAVHAAQIGVEVKNGVAT